ncbi:hypothetical protein HEP87_64300 [Streptomyces sp. S1D4-11]
MAERAAVGAAAHPQHHAAGSALHTAAGERLGGVGGQVQEVVGGQRCLVEVQREVRSAQRQFTEHGSAAQQVPDAVHRRRVRLAPRHVVHAQLAPCGVGQLGGVRADRDDLGGRPGAPYLFHGGTHRVQIERIALGAVRDRRDDDGHVRVDRGCLGAQAAVPDRDVDPVLPQQGRRVGDVQGSCRKSRSNSSSATTKMTVVMPAPGSWGRMGQMPWRGRELRSAALG